ncbi:MAG: dienelactone hydrolase family protein, partial [Nocardioidaceae bacterium]
VFAHGSGSSRRSPRNLWVAQALHEAQLATLVFDLLSPNEAQRDAIDASLRFDIPLLGDRLTAAVDQVHGASTTGSLPVGLFGASTGAAAALVCASQRPEVVQSVVSRGGRPDLAGEVLGRVHAPTLLLVGENDQRVMALNQDAARLMAGEAVVSVVARATHLFEEPGALEEVADRAARWFARTLKGAESP